MLPLLENLKKYNINISNLLIILTIFISTFFLFFNYKHTLNYGDQAIENIIATSQLDKIIRSDTDLNYRTFVRDNSKRVHGDKSNKENYNTYFVDPMIQGVAGDALLVKALPYLVHLIIHNIFFIDNYSYSYFLLSIFIYIFIFFSIISFCNSLKIENLKIILLIGYLSNIYVMQLHRSGLENHILFFIPIYFYTLSFIIRVFTNIEIPWHGYIFYPFIFSLSFLNGYPNTSTILPFFLAITVFCFYFYKFNIKEYLKKILIILASIFISIIFYIPESMIWSNILNENIFYHMKILPDRTITMFKILFSSNNKEAFVLVNFLNEKLILLSRFLKNIFFQPFIFHAPHEPGMLLGINFFNVFEKLFFIVGFFGIFLKRDIKILFLLNISIILCLVSRVFTHDNFQINKASFDYYLLCIYITYFGFYLFFEILLQKKLKLRIVNYLSSYLFFFYKSIKFSFIEKNLIIYSERNKNLNRFNTSLSLILISIVLFSSFYLNLNRFNDRFVFKYNESLRDLSALEPLKKFIKENKDENLFIIQQGHGYYANLDRILMLDNSINYEVLSNFKRINFEPYKKIFLITFNNSQVGPLRDFIIGNNFFNSNNINIFSYQEIFSSSAGYPSIYLHEVKETIKLFDVRKGKTNINIDKTNFEIKKILLENYRGNIILKCNLDEYTFKVSDISYDIYSLDFNKKEQNGLYYFENLFNNVDKKNIYKISKISSNGENILDQHTNVSNGYNFINDSEREFEYLSKYKLEEKIESFYIKFAYTFLNDIKKQNKLSVKYNKGLFMKKNIINIKSNGHNFYGRYKNFHGSTDLIQYTSYPGKLNKNELKLYFKTTNYENQDTSFLTSKNNNYQSPDADSIWLNFSNDEIYEFNSNCKNNLELSFNNKGYINGRILIYGNKK